MENEGMIIEQPRNDVTGKRENLHITMKVGQSDETLYHNIINIIEWSEKTNGNNAQKVFDMLKKKNFFKEHIFNPVA